MITKSGRHRCDYCGRYKGVVRGGIGPEDTSPLPGYLGGVARFGASWHISFDYCANNQQCFIKAALAGVKSYSKIMGTAT